MWEFSWWEYADGNGEDEGWDGDYDGDEDDESYVNYYGEDDSNYVNDDDEEYDNYVDSDYVKDYIFDGLMVDL